ncbi:hypothetical protein BDN67DRAFT_1069820 [Paxillus ammoniavirescens]|nr:hypothetical protein BDN67DRAFT_1069820 [Paxillus ammoniavirescens]
MHPSLFLTVAVPLIAAIGANAESHVIKFVNQCGYGSPVLMLNGKNVLTGDEYTSNGPFSGIGYLQTGDCNTNGENCTLLEMTLINPTCAGCGSSTDISLIPPHVYNVETSFAYYNGCDGVGTTCSDPNCSDSAFFVPDDNFVQVACQVDNVNLLVSFCATASQFVSGNSSSSTPAGAGTPSSTPLPPAPVMPMSSGNPMSSAMPTTPPVPTAPVLPAVSATPSTSPKQCRRSTHSQQKREPKSLVGRAYRHRSRITPEH